MKEPTKEDIKVGSIWEYKNAFTELMEKIQVDSFENGLVKFTILETNYNNFRSPSPCGYEWFLTNYKPVYTVEGFEV